MKALREPRKGLFYLYFYAVWLFQRKIPVQIIGCHTRPNLSWKIFRILGVVEREVETEVVYQHQDSTYSNESRAINGRCTDISKSTVSRIFEEIFQYELSVDPIAFSGEMVERSEVNSSHDGKIIVGPIARPINGRVYQRLIDNSVDSNLVEDLRPCIIGDEIPFVYRKRRPVGIRFSNDTTTTSKCNPSDVFSSDEQAKIVLFAKRIGLDVGEIDVLRDKTSGRIYIVDVAKTPHSPGDNYIGIGGVICMHKAAAAFKRQFLN